MFKSKETLTKAVSWWVYHPCMLEEIQPAQVLEENKSGWGKYWEVCQGENLFLGENWKLTAVEGWWGKAASQASWREDSRSQVFYSPSPWKCLSSNLIELISPGLSSPSSQRLRWTGTNMSRRSWEITSVLSFAGSTRWSSSILCQMWVSDEDEVIEIKIVN